MGRGSAAGVGTRPKRTCIGCRRVADSGQLVRVARRPDGGIAVGRSEPGRGAWLCADPGSGVSPKTTARGASIACFEAAVRRRAFRTALRRELGGAEIALLRERLVT